MILDPDEELLDHCPTSVRSVPPDSPFFIEKSLMDNGEIPIRPKDPPQLPVYSTALQQTFGGKIST